MIDVRHRKPEPRGTQDEKHNSHIGECSGEKDRSDRTPDDGRLMAADEMTPDISIPDSPVAGPVNTGEIIQFPIAEILLDHQPRQLVPVLDFERLLRSGEATVPKLLEVLQQVSQFRTHYRQKVLASVVALADDIRRNGVREPCIAEVDGQGRVVLREGHRRALASHMIGNTSVPMRLTKPRSRSDMMLTQFTSNIQRRDLTALEEARWWFEIQRQREMELRTEMGLPLGKNERTFVERKIQSSPEERLDEHRLSKRARQLLARLRDEHMVETERSQQGYYRRLRLLRLSPEAQEAGIGLTARHLAEILRAPYERQEAIAELTAERKLAVKAVKDIVDRVVKDPAADVAAMLQEFAEAPMPALSQSGFHWKPLVSFPTDHDDIDLRLNDLNAELAVLPAVQREPWIAWIEQRWIAMGQLHARLSTILMQYGRADQSTMPLTSEGTAGSIGDLENRMGTLPAKNYEAVLDHVRRELDALQGGCVSSW